MLTKSEKSNGCPGVLGNRLPPPGVVIIEDGNARAAFRGGGVEGGSMRDFAAADVILSLGWAGEGDCARYSRRSTPSWLAFPLPLPAILTFLSLPRRLRLLWRMGGVEGGEERDARKECTGPPLPPGRSSSSSFASSSSESDAKLGDSRASEMRLEVWKNETSGPVDVVKCCCRRGLIGELCASW